MRTLILIAVMMAAGACQADDRAKEEADCMEDAMRLCSAAIPNVTRIRACMTEHVDRLSPSCRAHFKSGD